VQQQEAAELPCDHRHVLVRFLGRERLEHLLEPRDAFVQLTVAEIDLCEPGGDAGRRVVKASLLEGFSGLLEQGSRLVAPAPPPRHAAGAVLEVCASKRIIGEVGGLLEVALPFPRSPQGGCALARPRQHLPRFDADLTSAVDIRAGTVSVEVVRGEHLDDLLLLSEGRLEVGSSRQVTCTALLL
jgi:hypothetical protein